MNFLLPIASVSMTEILPRMSKKTAMADLEEPSFQFPSPLAPILLLLLGIVLVATSFLPLKEFMTPAWDTSDSAQMAQLRMKYHDSSYTSPERQGITSEEAAQMQEKMKSEIEKLEAKLSLAKAAPKFWSRILFWSGVLISAIGALWQRST